MTSMRDPSLGFAPLPAGPVPFQEAEGRVLAEALLADRDDPPSPKSAMDGFALVAGHTHDASPGRPLTFHYREVIAARRLAGGALPAFPEAGPAAAGLPAVRIMTGALLPAGADAVVKLEDTEQEGPGPDGLRPAPAADARRFRIRRPLAPGENVIPPGARMARGELLLPAGEVLGPQALGMLAGAHRFQVQVHRQPMVALLALGDELVDVGDPLHLGQVRLTNLHVLAALVRRYGGIARPLGVAPDDPERIRATLAACLTGGQGTDCQGNGPPCDLVLTLGGSHRGDFDFVHTVLERLGAQLRFDRIRMTPGGSTIFATHGSTLLFGLPGTPAAAWVAFEMLVRPALWKLAGRHRLDLPRLTARLAAPLPEAPGRTQFVACRLDLAGTAERLSRGANKPAESLSRSANKPAERLSRGASKPAVPLAHPIQGQHPHEAPATPRADGLIPCLEEHPLPAVGELVSVDWLAD
jgi:molybdopterin molybdotransferase